MANNCTRLIEIDRLVFADNVRTPECLAIPAMVASLKRHGWKNNHPLVLHDQADGFLVLIGNRRGLGLLWLRDNEPEEYKRVLPGGKIPAVVHKGLTKEEIVDMRIDHSSDEDRVPLDEWSVFLAIRQLVQVGMDTQERIAEKLGLYKLRGKEKGQPNRQYVQPRVNLARLPVFVQAEFSKLCREGKDSTAVRWANVPRLYKAHSAEYATHPEGNGPLFLAAWKKATTPPEVSADTSPDGDSVDPKELSPAEAIKRSQAASSEGLKYALLALTRQSSRSLAEIDTAILEGESATRTLAIIRAYMGDKGFAELLDAATKHAAETAPTDDTADAMGDQGRPIGESEYDHPSVEA